MTTATFSAPRTMAPLVGTRLVAALAAAGGAAHLATLTAPFGFHAGFFAAMALGCLGCAAHLARSGSPRALVTAAVMAAAMLVLHLGYLLATAPAFAGVEHVHGGAVVVTASATSHSGHHDLSWATLVPLLPELAVLALTGPLLRRGRTASLP
ncbi:hypothetical protein KIH74_13455 [Kineosporia sp. J2-2]|uniref:Uncharacterized protein n=1 Tax=Kineosporia corallincola TaxID=2835133 RepID=A0ABS5TFR9_9ACTN|nr:hypothetical protein [Kineosporia corallincola]MBT0769938.1 hypothetical protein [Kineosporia corallincola]